MAAKPLLAITLGDPAGVGPWTSSRAALDPRVLRLCRPLLVGDAWVLQKFVGRPAFRVRPITSPEEFSEGKNVVNVLHVPHPKIRNLVPGRPQKLSGESAALSIRAAAALALQKRVAAVVTGPVSKESFKMAGLSFPGHTEMLASLSGAPRVEMLMAAGPLLTLLLTRHIPLMDVVRNISSKKITASVFFVDSWMKKTLGISSPRWALCGLNPHAGDKGLIGREEIKFLAPAAKALKARGVDIGNPLPADAAWAAHVEGKFHIVASIYHDQGMIPLKTLYPRRVVNMTAGLPWIRTSPGHGTAFDLSREKPLYKNADPSATVEAALRALSLAFPRKMS